MTLVDFPAREVRRANQAAEDVSEEYREYGEDGQVLNTTADPNYLTMAPQHPNLALLMTDEELARIGQRVVSETQVDEQSRAKWKERNDQALKIATLNPDPKTFPWPNASNVVLPLITTACIQFQARAYPALVQPPMVVRGQVIGSDKGIGAMDPATGQMAVVVPEGAKQKRADRIAKHMSYQLLEEMDGWEEDTDKLLQILPLTGVVFRKTYYDAALGKNCSELVLPDRCIVNYTAKNLETAPRITQEFDLYPWEIQERMRSDVYRREDLGRATDNEGDDDAPHAFYEQHRRYDIDEDGYAEPYIVTVHKESQKVVRIIARWDPDGVLMNDRGQVAKIEPVHYFTKYGFIPALDGSFYDIGFGYLLSHHNEAINSIINRLLDAGTLANMGAGFYGRNGGGVEKPGVIRLTPGEYKPMDMTNGGLQVQQVNFPQPSVVLFQLLGMLVDSAKELSSVQDVLVGDQPGANVPATTTLAMIEQGLKVFSGITKRQFRSQKSEFKKLYRLNSIHLTQEKYFQWSDEEQAISAEDYRAGDADVVPVADPNVVTDMQELARAQFLMQFAMDPLFNPHEIRKRVLMAGKIQDIDELLIEPQKGPDPAAQQAEELAKRRYQLEESKLLAEVTKLQADTMLTLAKAEAEEVGSSLEPYRAWMERLKLQAGMKDGEGRVRDVESPPDDGALSGLPEGSGGAAEGGMGEPSAIPVPAAGPGGGALALPAGQPAL